MRRVRPLRTAGSASSVQTRKVFKVWGPKDVASGISVASRPRATVMRPMRGMLWRASKVNQRPSIHWSGIRRHADVAQKSVGVTRRNVHAAAESDGEMGEIAANAHPLLIGFIGSTGGAGILIAERQMVADEIADRLNPAPAAKCRSEQLPSDVTKLVGFAITAAERKNQRVVWQSFDRDLFGIELDRIGPTAILDDGVAANG